MVHAVFLNAYGGPEALVWQEFEPGEPGPGQAAIRQRAVGVNYIDIYHRTGLYRLPAFPAVIGMEGAGDVVKVGPGVTEVKVGDRVAYAGVLGGYAEERLIPADRLVKLPDAISYETAAAMMLRGMTARFLLRETYRVTAETQMLFHAAAGGVGHIACQWARALGATLIGTVGSDDKGKLALEHGAAQVINYRRENFVERIREITGGKGVDVVYDSVGRETFQGSLDCLKSRGLMVSFGNSSGAVPPFDLSLLKGSLFVTRPSLMAYTASRAELLENANELFDMVTSGKIKITINHTYALKDAAQAHRDLEARRTTGSIVLLA